jgi:hypothetical protein
MDGDGVYMCVCYAGSSSSRLITYGKDVGVYHPFPGKQDVSNILLGEYLGQLTPEQFTININVNINVNFNISMGIIGTQPIRAVADMSMNKNGGRKRCNAY